MNKFEQLIEFVINDEEQKARDLFHDIVVEKSRSIYESLMAEEEELDEAKDEEELDESEEELDESAEEAEELDENLDGMCGAIGGDQSDDLIDDVEAEEEGMSFEGEDDLEAEFADEEGGEDLEDRVVDLEDKLDELMAEFESLLGGDEAGAEGGDDGEELDFDSEEEVDAEDGEETEMDDTEFEVAEALEEAVTLQKAPAPTTSEESFVNKKSINDDNSGAAGMEAKPVKTSGAQENGRTAPKAGELIGKVQNSVGGDKKLSPATKPTLSQASGVNTKTPFPKN
jgi:hypothetical protein